ncbi:aspartyl-phosphate phosphatase Spo0E family protein [Paenibacillus montanisoli]|uniref:Aspartyl-phosphate phosphatase Spo0E family protein n=1 Tax=Paenibacillus montanisoli TaxID=2081970 RepID=A0A328U7I9_9BACL|nr:hypothetical protein DL346_11260 [Paenibacillus montanisoli]
MSAEFFSLLIRRNTSLFNILACTHIALSASTRVFSIYLFAPISDTGFLWISRILLLRVIKRTENDAMESYMKEKIESLRFEMYDQACKLGSLTHEKVIHVSQQLDRYIFVYQKLQRKRYKRKSSY